MQAALDCESLLVGINHKGWCTVNESSQKLPGEGYSDKIRARFWIVGNDQSAYVGIGRIELLQKIEALGSMNQAAKSMGMSYKKAWKIIQELNTMYSEPLVVKEVGGKAGGGSVVTDRGKKLIADFKFIEMEMEAFLQKLSQDV